MSNEQILLTPDGLEKLQQELEELKGVGRRELAARIKLAISYGDLKENSEYHSAKNDQAFMETRILTLQNMIKRAVVTQAKDTSTVQVGATVVLNDVEFGEQLQYQIVGAAEADVLDNKVSYESPLGHALIGKKVGDTIKVNAPMGTIEYELLEIRA